MKMSRITRLTKAEMAEALAIAWEQGFKAYEKMYFSINTEEPKNPYRIETYRKDKDNAV